MLGVIAKPISSFINLSRIYSILVTCAMCAIVNQIWSFISVVWFLTKLDFCELPGPWFNIKMSSYQYRKSHWRDKTSLWPSYLHNGISYTGKMTSLYWIRAQAALWHTSPSQARYQRHGINAMLVHTPALDFCFCRTIELYQSKSYFEQTQWLRRL